MINGAATRTAPFRVLALLLAVCAAQAQQPPKDFTDPVALLKAVAGIYATGAGTFRMESIAEITSNADLRIFKTKMTATRLFGLS